MELLLATVGIINPTFADECWLLRMDAWLDPL